MEAVRTSWGGQRWGEDGCENKSCFGRQISNVGDG